MSSAGTPRGLLFGTAAESYERFRLGYPDEVVVRTLSHADRPVATAVEVGAGTGKATDPQHVRAVKDAAGDGVPVFVGSGVTAEMVGQFLPHADGFIVGTAFKRDGVASEPVEVERVREFVARLG